MDQVDTEDSLVDDALVVESLNEGIFAYVGAEAWGETKNSI